MMDVKCSAQCLACNPTKKLKGEKREMSTEENKITIMRSEVVLSTGGVWGRG